MRNGRQERLSAESLKSVLWSTLNGVRTRKVDIETANAISANAREILRATKIQLQTTMYGNEELSVELREFSTGAIKSISGGRAKQIVDRSKAK